MELRAIQIHWSGLRIRALLVVVASAAVAFQWALRAAYRRLAAAFE